MTDNFPISALSEVECVTCGASLERQTAPQHTQLNAKFFVPKNHPRIRLRGMLDTLHAQALVASHCALETGYLKYSPPLEELAEYCRELVSAEYNERVARRVSLQGLDADDLHAASHHPETLGTGHLQLDGKAPALQHWLNMFRVKCRETELAAYDAFPVPASDQAMSISAGLNLLSSAVYYLQLRVATEESS